MLIEPIFSSNDEPLCKSSNARVTSETKWKATGMQLTFDRQKASEEEIIGKQWEKN